MLDIIIVKCVLLVVGLGYMNAYKCGPKLQCHCEKDTMDCTAMDDVMKVRTICKSIGNTSINVLLAGENDFTHVSQADMKGCENLQKLDFHGNQLSNLENNSLANLKRLCVLDLSNNKLNVYTNTFNYSALPKYVQVLNLKGNWPMDTPFTGTSSHILRYPDLSTLTSLHTLYMDGFQAGFGSDYTNTSITHLCLSGLPKHTDKYCKINLVEDSMFSNLTNIRHLNLSGCSIENIHAGAFEQLSNLEILDLSYNRRLGFEALSNVSYGLQFTNISVLNYSHVYTTFRLGTEILKRDLCYLWNTSLREITLDGNRLEMFETNAIILFPETLENIYMTDNKFTFELYLLQVGCISNARFVNASFQNKFHNPAEYLFEPKGKERCRDRGTYSSCPFMTDDYLRYIASIKHCKYIEENTTEFDFDPYLPPKLETLLFNDCKMSYNVGIGIDIKPNNNIITHIDMSGNALIGWSRTIGPFPELRSLDLSRNYCSYIGPSVFDEMPSLESLHLDKNYLGDILSDESAAQIFHNLKSLRSLSLTSNRISTLYPSTFSQLKRLTTLDLSFNSIETFTLNTSSMTHLLHLNLSVNSIRSLPESLRTLLEDNSRRRNKSFSVDLRNNSLSYNCENKDFLEWLVEHQTNMFGFDHYIFVTDTYQRLSPSFVSKNALQLRKSCQSFTLIIVFCSICITLFLSIVIGGIVYKTRWKIRYFLYMSKTKYFGYRRLDDESILEVYRHDAFISYDEGNIRFILDRVIPNLETPNITLCIHQRDFIAGNAIADNIIDAIKSSRKTVVILSRTFLKKKWCMYEFNMARMESIYSRDDTGCLIIVMLEDVPIQDMPLELTEWINEHSYIQYPTEEQDEMNFWYLLRAAIVS